MCGASKLHPKTSAAATTACDLPGPSTSCQTLVQPSTQGEIVAGPTAFIARHGVGCPWHLLVHLRARRPSARKAAAAHACAACTPNTSLPAAPTAHLLAPTRPQPMQASSARSSMLTYRRSPPARHQDRLDPACQLMRHPQCAPQRRAACLPTACSSKGGRSTHAITHPRLPTLKLHLERPKSGPRAPPERLPLARRVQGSLRVQRVQLPVVLLPGAQSLGKRRQTAPQTWTRPAQVARLLTSCHKQACCVGAA